MRAHTHAAATLLSLALALGAGAPDAQAGDPITRLAATDGAPSDNLGAASAVSGTTAIVAAPRDDVNGTQSGSAYLFDVTSGEELLKLTPDDGVAFDSFGFAVSISGSRALGGSYKDDDNGSSSGSAYVFDTATGSQLHKLLPSDGAAGDSFGFAVALSGNLAVVGSPGDDDLGSGAGSAYLFDASTGAQLFKLTASDGAAGDVLGNSVAIDGTTVVVGAPGKNGSTGAAYVFDGATGQQLHELTASSGQASSFFGRAVGVSAGRAVVGAPFATFGAPSAGLAYLFDTSTGGQLATLFASDAASNDRYGNAVAISGDRALVSAWADEDFGELSGSVYVVDVLAGQQIAKLTAHDASSFDQFGESVGLSGDRAVVGAISAPGAAVNTGAAYGITLADDLWQNLASGLAGAAGVPSLLGAGDLSPASDLCLALGQSAAEAQVFVVVGVSPLFLPFKGGTLVPSPDLILDGLSTDVDGQLVIQTVFPTGSPSGVPVYVQAWIVDGSGSHPYAASNGILRSTP